MTTITRRTAIAGSAAIALAPNATATEQPSRIEQLFAELVAVKQQLANDDLWLRDDNEEIFELQSREDGLLARIAVHRATCTSDIFRKLQAWALVYCINPDDIREHGPNEDFPAPACSLIIASLLEDTMKLKSAPLHGLTYPRRRLENSTHPKSPKPRKAPKPKGKAAELEKTVCAIQDTSFRLHEQVINHGNDIERLAPVLDRYLDHFAAQMLSLQRYMRNA